MSIDFDSAALQTQHDEEEYDPEDYAREQELHKLLTDLPDDMLEDSVDSSSPELEYTTCSHKNTGNSPQSAWTQQWSDHSRPTSHEQKREVGHDQRSHDEYAYEDEAGQNDGHHPQSGPLPNAWNLDHQFSHADYTYTSIGSEKCTDTNDFSTDENKCKPYPHGTNNAAPFDGQEGRRDIPNYGHHNNGRDQFQILKSRVLDGGVDPLQAKYNPHLPAHQPQMFTSQAVQQEGQFDHLQREFLDSTQQTADKEQLAQLQILNKAQQRQIEDLERKLEDSRRNMRYIEHQFAIAKDEKDGLAVSLKESSQLVEHAKERDVQMQSKVKAMEHQLQVLTERDQENLKKQSVAEAAVDSMKQQMLELCRSDTLSRTRQQHDRDLAVMKEQHENAVLTLQQKLDSTSQALNEKIDVGQRLREQVKQLEQQREEEQLERARVVNTLTQRLEESQQQCAKLLETSSVQEMSQLQIRLQQAQSAKALSENMNKVLQEDLADLKEQITLYESAVKHGVIAVDPSSDWENQLSDSCVDLGFKKTNRKNDLLHSAVLAHMSDSKLPKDEALRRLRVEMQRCLGSLKGKRKKISQLQEELHLSQSRLTELQTQLDEAKLCSSARETSQMKHLDMNGESRKEFARLLEDKQHLQEQVEVLEQKNMELKQSEEKVKSDNLELCIKMREMIQELDQEKQESTERAERIHQQYRDDVVDRVRTELMLDHDAQVEQLTAQHQQLVQQLQTQLSEANDKMLAVQECYISVCKEKDMLGKEEAVIRVNEEKMIEEHGRALEKLRAELEAQHQASINQIQALWSKDKRTEIQQQVNSQVASAKAAWEEELQKMEKIWGHRLEEANRAKHKETAEAACQADDIEASSATVTMEELDSRLSAQKQQLQLEADKVKRKAVEEASKQAQRGLHEKHLEDMAKQVEGAVTRAYNRWIEDLTSSTEYQTALQRERENWEALHEKNTEQRVSQALKEAEEQWFNKHQNQPEGESSGRVEDLQEEVASLQSQLEQERREQATLLKAELAGARAAWNQEKQEMQEQRKKLEQALQQAREDAALREKQMEAKLQQTLGAKKEWKSVDEEKLSRVLKETPEQHERGIDEMQSFLSERKEEQVRCRKCAETLGKLQKKNQELQRHLEKACRQLQHTVRQHKTDMQHLKDQHESNLQKAKERHLQQLEEVKTQESSSSDHQQNVQQGLKEMKQQYLMTVEKIRGDMLRYLQESRERAAETIRMEVQRERQNTARKMQRYYLTCRQELLEDAGKTTGAKQMITAASQLAGMAKVLETPFRSRSGKSYSSECRNLGFSKNLPTLDEPPEIRPEERPHREKTLADSAQKRPARPKLLSHQDFSPPGREEASSDAGLKPRTVRGKSREPRGHPDPMRRSEPLLARDAAIRDGKRGEWSVTRSDSDVGLWVSTHSGGRVEPGGPLSVSSADSGEYGNPDASDLTIYNEITKKRSSFQHALISGHREPPPGSEGEKQHGVGCRPFFSELRQRRQDSGFDSPLN
ncbi:centrosomal protein of 152 kDa isoform X4 [Gasterosteus aculeatus]